MNEALFWRVFLFLADTPKSAEIAIEKETSNKFNVCHTNYARVTNGKFMFAKNQTLV